MRGSWPSWDLERPRIRGCRRSGALVALATAPAAAVAVEHLGGGEKGVLEGALQSTMHRTVRATDQPQPTPIGTLEQGADGCALPGTTADAAGPAGAGGRAGVER